MKRIALDTGLTEGPSNVYVFTGSPVTLVDTGINRDQTRSNLIAGLSKYGYSVADIDQIVLTHFHADHSGLAGFIQEQSDATVYIHEADLEMAYPTESRWQTFCNREQKLLRDCAVPLEQRRIYTEVQSQNYDLYGDKLEVTAIRDGDQLPVGSTELTVHHTPGHTSGSCCFTSKAHGVLTGDTLLPEYTPNIGGGDLRLSNPLGTYVSSLQELAELVTDARAIPGHRDPIMNASARIGEVLRHHQKQAMLLLSVLEGSDGLSVWDIANQLYGNLERIHIMLGIGETYALLEYLEGTDLLAKSDTSYLRTVTEPERIESVLDECFPT